MAQRALSPTRLVGRAGSGPSRLRGDGAKDVVAFAEEVSPRCSQPEAALTEDHASAGRLGGTRPLVVLQLGQVGSVAVGDELEEMNEQLIRQSINN